MGFDIAPVKGSRRAETTIVSINGESGTMTAAVWCQDHVPTKTIVHPINEIVDTETGLNALQLYVRNFKQADLTLTGTVRKATLVNQSAKVANPALAVQNVNRRTSTATSVNGSTGRGSVSHAKTDEVDSLESKVEAEKTCATCQVDVSPRWWPFPPDLPEKSETILNANGNDIADSPMVNGNGTQEVSQENGESHVALAVAALEDTVKTPPPRPAEFQCHQCHWKKIRKEPTPPPPPPPPAPRESPRLPISMPAAPPDVEPSQPLPPSYWPAPPSYPPREQPSYNWPHRSPAPQQVGVVHQLNGNRSPHLNPGGPSLHNVQPPMRHSSHGLPRSPPRQNGHLNQIPNGYPHPPSPHQPMRSPAMHMNAVYPSYTSTRPPPQHLTNGGPPPRASEHPFLPNHGPSMHHRQSSEHFRQPYGSQQASPSMHQSPHQISRDATHPHNNGARPTENRDNRVNGGASASPSLRNLLS